MKTALRTQGGHFVAPDWLVGKLVFRSDDPDSVHTPNWGQGDASPCRSRAEPSSPSADGEIPIKKALKESGGKQEFSPSAISPLNQTFLKNSPVDCF